MIWLIGSNGQLGTEVANLLTEKKYRWIGTNSEVDISSFDAVCNFEAKNETESYYQSKMEHYEKQIKWIINCSAYDNVDACENEEEAKEKAIRVNTSGPTNLARLCREIGAKLIHVSTDYVYNGVTNHPYTEKSSREPINNYGLSKLYGELSVEKDMVQYYIFRTSWLYGGSSRIHKNNFVTKLLENLKEKGTVDVVADQTACPTYAPDLAEAIIRIMEKAENATEIIGPKSAPAFGVYNFCNSGEVSRYCFAQEVLKYAKKYGIISKDCEINPVCSNQFPNTAKRPEYSALDTAKIQKELKIRIPDWKHSLEKYMKILRKK